MWILITPNWAVADEPAHLVRAAGLVRGHIRGDEAPRRPTVVVPAWIPTLEPICFILDPNKPASCLADREDPPGSEVRSSKAYDYPVWSHLLPGFATFAGSSRIGVPLARLLAALIPVALIGFSLMRAMRRSRWFAAAGVLAVTPMAWSMITAIQPSGMAIAGGLALSVSLIAPRRSSPVNAAPTGSDWLMIAGLAALMLPRRDGAIWACAIVAASALLQDQPLTAPWRTLTTRGRAAVLGIAALTALWSITADGRLAIMLLLAPVILIGTAIGRKVATRSPVGLLMMASAGALIAYRLVGALSPNGIDRRRLEGVISRTGLRLGESIGVLGWLEIPVPATARFLWLVALGCLAGAALSLNRTRSVLVAALVIGVAVALSWSMELVVGRVDSVYWQGRYYLPLLISVPLILAASGSSALDGAPTRVVAAIALIVNNVALMQSCRRWAVGFDGALNPMVWNTYNTVAPPVLLLAVHCGASYGLYRWLTASASPTVIAVGR